MIPEVQNYTSIKSFYSSENSGNKIPTRPLNSFETEDEAIISAQAKLMNELEKYNSRQGDELDLALACITGKNQVKAAARVIETKKDMLDTILDMASE